jgi:hypothetical protein
LKIIICTVALETRGAKKKNALVQGILEKTTLQRRLQQNPPARGSAILDTHATAGCSPGGDCSPHVSAALHTAVLSSATGIGAGRNRGPAAKNWSTATRTCTHKQCLHKCSATEQQYAGAPFVAETTCGQNVHSGLARPKSTLSSLDAPKHSCADLLILLHRSVIIKTRRRCGLNIRSWTKSGTETITSVRRCVNTDADTVADRFCVSNL